MFQRISKVNSLTTQSIIFSSMIQIGDCSYIDGTSYVLAVQRKSNILHEREDQFSDYKIYQQPATFPIINEPLQTRFDHMCPFIEIGNIRLIGMSTSAVANIGNVGHIRMKTKIHHTRQLNSSKGSPSTSNISNKN